MLQRISSGWAAADEDRTPVPLADPWGMQIQGKMEPTRIDALITIVTAPVFLSILLPVCESLLPFIVANYIRDERITRRVKCLVV